MLAHISEPEDCLSTTASITKVSLFPVKRGSAPGDARIGKFSMGRVVQGLVDRIGAGEPAITNTQESAHTRYVILPHARKFHVTAPYDLLPGRLRDRQPVCNPVAHAPRFLFGKYSPTRVGFQPAPYQYHPQKLLHRGFTWASYDLTMGLELTHDHPVLGSPIAVWICVVDPGTINEIRCIYNVRKRVWMCFSIVVEGLMNIQTIVGLASQWVHCEWYNRSFGKSRRIPWLSHSKVDYGGGDIGVIDKV
ncbi:hypothetical protein B0J17DRAFT_632058 [Rhizoctonia solani]|nr:hypothetical protein B0J17DRAFT_632058 [Rhizoctonia solani]